MERFFWLLGNNYKARFSVLFFKFWKVVVAEIQILDCRVDRDLHGELARSFLIRKKNLG